MKWCLGNAVAADAGYVEVADFAVSLSPSDPQTHYALAVLSEKNFTPESLANSIAEYERAAALAPEDYRAWLALGKARERGDDLTKAELALRKSRALAPNNSDLGWILGNFLLRRGQTAEAFAEMRKAAEDDPKYVDPTVSTAWRLFDGDLTRIRQYLGDSPTVTSAFVAYLAREKRFDDAVKIWNSLPSEEKKRAYKENGKVLFNQMLAAGKFREAFQISVDIGDTDAEKFAVGKIFNGDFETDVKAANANLFEWQIQDGLQPQIGVDDKQKHGGARSLVVVFNSPNGRDFRNVLQTVAVESARKYVFEFFYKSELKTSATVYWEIIDTANGKTLAATAPISASSDWTNSRAEFTAPENTEAVIVRLARENCKSIICPISGRIWFDDMTLAR